MLKLRKGTKPKLVLLPREGFKKTHKEIELKLVHGHQCPTCQNVIHAVAEAPYKIDLFPYETTRILSQGEENGGETLKFIPNAKDRDSGYEIRYHRSPDPKKPGLLHLRMKNHVIPPYAERDESAKREAFEQKGERPCFKTGFFSMREDLLMKDFLMLMGFHELDLVKYNLPKVTEFLPSQYGNNEGLGEYRWIPAVGNAPPIILVDRAFLKECSTYALESALDPFRKNTEA